MQILCIDDDRTFLKLFETSLKKWQRPEDRLFLAGSGKEAFEILGRANMEVVITDLVLPDVNGIEILKHVKGLNRNAEVIVVTGQGSIDSAVEAMRLGARDYLTKPLNTGILTEKLDNIREFIERGKEAEEYRYAKEAIETGASQTVAEMEIKLNGYMSAARNIDAVVKDGQMPADEKIGLIETILSRLQIQ